MKGIIKDCLILFVITLIAGAALGVVYDITKEPIAAQEAKKKVERIVVNPSTGKRMLVPPKIALSFKPSALLKSKINKQ